MENEKINEDELNESSEKEELEMQDDYLGSCVEAISVLNEINDSLFYFENGSDRQARIKEKIFDIMEHEVQRMHNDLFKQKSGEI